METWTVVLRRLRGNYAKHRWNWKQSHGKRNVPRGATGWTGSREETSGGNFRRFDETAENAGEMNVCRGNHDSPGESRCMGQEIAKVFHFLSPPGRVKLSPETIKIPAIAAILWTF